MADLGYQQTHQQGHHNKDCNAMAEEKMPCAGKPALNGLAK
jgi:hypothetical protein